MHVPSLIEHKRDGGELTDGEIRSVMRAFTAGDIPEYQMAALAMAIYFRGMTGEETASLTRAMLESGERMEYPADAPRIVDKHSTGGVGDKVSLVLAPLLACAGVWVPMISGRGLGITGGTLDKLESIPGFRTGLTGDEALAQLETVGAVMMGQTGTICPADRRLYALRDVTGTVPSRPLIVASILSKKLAESLDALVLDVKFGAGAFMKTREDADALGEAMRVVGESMGVETHVCHHPMDEPLGRAVGNALEVAEAVDTLRGGGPPDLRRIVLTLAERVAPVDEEALARWLDDGSAWARFQRLVERQGGDPAALERITEAHAAPLIRDIPSPRGGTITRLDAEAVGRAAMALGAGRSRAEDEIDHAVGFDRIAKTGQTVAEGDPVARVHARDEAAAEAATRAFLDGLDCS